MWKMCEEKGENRKIIERKEKKRSPRDKEQGKLLNDELKTKWNFAAKS